ncbi:hypothetical protein [Halostreptopolyspora alba]
MRKSKESKAQPLWKDLSAIVVTNLVAAVSLLLFGAMGLAIASLGAAAS